MVQKKRGVRTVLITSIFLVLAAGMTHVAAQIRKEKNIPYISGISDDAHRLDIYYPRDTTRKKEIVVFFHGGSWRHGKKETYRLLGKNLARKGFVAIITNYRLSPEVAYAAMAEDCAQAITWAAQHGANYGGDASKIVAAGHSAGGHLAALIAVGKTFDTLHLTNPINKVILIDAFGLDLYRYFQEYDNDYSRSLYPIFTDHPETWKAASPQYAINKENDLRVPFLVLTGARTYPAIIESSERFVTTVRQLGGEAAGQVIHRKRHIGMIVQFFFRHNKAYPLLTGFIRR